MNGLALCVGSLLNICRYFLNCFEFIDRLRIYSQVSEQDLTL